MAAAGAVTVLFLHIAQAGLLLAFPRCDRVIPGGASNLALKVERLRDSWLSSASRNERRQEFLPD